ncbi:hypothetical protein [Alkalilacustris brevis]|uniref:hypothetical protein n=1 Tax=Alkalilacustris brevis TaxID=2026338 RepID=UPI00192E5B6D
MPELDRSRALFAAAALAIAFGLLTIASGGGAILGVAEMGAVVPFVLWFNFFAGFAYVVAGNLRSAARNRVMVAFSLPAVTRQYEEFLMQIAGR